jgi:hypothetical protein
LEFPQFTHHDFRHFFATTCIESGVDISTVSRWFGHKDGGALAMKRYGQPQPTQAVGRGGTDAQAPLGSSKESGRLF